MQKIGLIMVVITISIMTSCNNRINNTKLVENIVNEETVTDCHDEFVKTIDGYAFTKLGLACYMGDLNSSKKLIEAGSCINRCMSDEIYEYDVLYTSVMFNKINLVEYFINIKDNINQIYDENGMTLLSLACNSNQPDIALNISKSLLRAGANVNGSGDVEGDYIIYPLLEAVKKNNVKLVKLLIEKGADITVSDKQGETIFTLIKDRDDINSDMKKYISSLYIIAQKWQGKYSVSIKVENTASISYYFTITENKVMLETNTYNAPIRCNGEYIAKEDENGVLTLTYSGDENYCGDELFKIKMDGNLYYIQGVGGEETSDEWLELKKT